MKTFSHRWAQFSSTYLLLRMKEPIVTKQERKTLCRTNTPGQRWTFSHFLAPTSTVNWVALFKTPYKHTGAPLSTRFFNFPPVRAFFFFFRSTHSQRLKASASQGAKNLMMKILRSGWENRRKKKKAFQRQKSDARKKYYDDNDWWWNLICTVREN